MGNKSKRRPQIGTTELTKRTAKKDVTVGDLPAKTDRTRSAKGGFTTANDHARIAIYQHNQTDLEFVR